MGRPAGCRGSLRKKDSFSVSQAWVFSFFPVVHVVYSFLILNVANRP